MRTIVSTMAAALAVSCWATAAKADPITLPVGTVEATLLGNYTNWAAHVATNDAVSGESAALGLDVGVADRVQAGLAIALPINPGASFGSVLLSGSFAATPNLGLRLDVGAERLGANNAPAFVTSSHTARVLTGLGFYGAVPLAQGVEFVWGRSGATRLARFLNLDAGGGTGFYYGGTIFSAAASDTFVFSTGDNDSGVFLDLNVPLGLKLRPDPHLSFTLQAGYSATVVFPTRGSGSALHYVPVGLEAVVSPTTFLDIGANLTFDGYVATSGGDGGNGPGYFDMRTVLFWVKLRTGT
jgi:hypothetical protein